MGLADIALNDLSSRTVRNAIGDNGVRSFDPTAGEIEERDNNGNLLRVIWNGVRRLAGWLLNLVQGVLGLVGFTATALWAAFVSVREFVWNFNWNVTDTEIDAQIKAAWSSFAGLLGGTVGNSVGYLACGVLPGATTFVFNQPLGAYILANVGEEMADEFVANLSLLVQSTFQSAMQSLILWGFKNVRKFLKKNPVLVERLLGEKAAGLLEAWGEEGSKPWSFASALEEKIESIDNVFVRNFVEEFLEEAWDGCVEAGFVVANSIDTFIAQQALMRRQQQELLLGRNRIVEIQPDREISNERIILDGPENLLRPAIVQTMSNYQLLDNRDVGTLVGQPVDDYLRARPQSLRLIITSYAKSEPPWVDSSGNPLTPYTYAIPNVKRTKCDWAEIKKACGSGDGSNGWMWGRYKAYWPTGMNNGRNMFVHGATEAEAEERLRAFTALTEADPHANKPSFSEDRKEDVSGTYLKQPKRIYPAYFSIFNTYRAPGAVGSGLPIQGRRYVRKRDRILLWPSEKPPGTDARIQRMLERPGAEDNSATEGTTV